MLSKVVNVMEDIINKKLAHISSEDRSAIKKIVSCFVDALHPLAVYLFGSVAENRIREYSDYDFYIVVDDKTPDKNFNLCYKAQLSIGDNSNRACDVLVDKESYFNKTKDNVKSLEYNVFHKGVKLYER